MTTQTELQVEIATLRLSLTMPGSTAPFLPLTVSQAARRAGVTTEQWNLWESGANAPHETSWAKAKRALRAGDHGEAPHHAGLFDSVFAPDVSAQDVIDRRVLAELGAREAAGVVGVDPRTWKAWEAGTAACSAEMLRRFEIAAVAYTLNQFRAEVAAKSKIEADELAARRLKEWAKANPVVAKVSKKIPSMPAASHLQREFVYKSPDDGYDKLTDVPLTDAEANRMLAEMKADEERALKKRNELAHIAMGRTAEILADDS